MQLNGLVADRLDLTFDQLTRYVAPLVEETLKAAIVVVLLRTHRVGFLIDAAICGFAVGTGFAAVENLWYLKLLPSAGLGVWFLRGFGTAIMHGGASALFAIVTLAMLERHGRIRWHTLLPGLLIAIALHSAYNHFFLSPFLSTVGVLLVLPPLLYYAFQRSERAVGDWVGKGFDSRHEHARAHRVGTLRRLAGRPLPAVAEGQARRPGRRRCLLLPAPAHRTRAPRQGPHDAARKRLRHARPTPTRAPSSANSVIYERASAARC